MSSRFDRNFKRNNQYDRNNIDENKIRETNEVVENIHTSGYVDIVSNDLVNENESVNEINNEEQMETNNEVKVENNEKQDESNKNINNTNFIKLDKDEDEDQFNSVGVMWKHGNISTRCSSLNLREKPSKDAKVIDTIKAKEPVKFSETDDIKWVMVKYGSKQGYCMFEFIEPER